MAIDNKPSFEQLQSRLSTLEKQLEAQKRRVRERRRWSATVAAILFAGMIGYSVGDETSGTDNKPVAITGERGIRPMPFADEQAFTSTYDAGNKLGREVHAKAYRLFREGNWQGLERLFTLAGANGGWPPNNGFIRIDTMTLSVGTQIDRYGGWYKKNGSDSTFTDSGTFASPSGNSFDSRALQQWKTNGYYRRYTVKRNIPNVQVGEAIPWFGFDGMGLQFNLPKGIDELLKDGFIAAN